MRDPSSSLRERRRRQTARDIQDAALQLIRDHGFAHVTTEMIAQEAGISLRTFFNYFPNKEAAAVGPAPHIDKVVIADFVASKGPLVEDLTQLVREQLQVNPPRKETIRTIHNVVSKTPDLQTAFRGSLLTVTAQIETALIERLSPTEVAPAGLLAELFGLAMSRTFNLWAHSETMSPDDALQHLKEQLRGLGDILRAG